MERYTLQQRIEIIKIHYKNGENFTETVRKVKSFLGRREVASWPTTVKLVRKLELLGQVSNVKNRTHAEHARTPANIASVAHTVENETGAAVSVNRLRYLTMINEFLWPKLEVMGVDDVYLQQDGAT